MEVNIHEAKTHLSRLLERVEPGEEITIMRANAPVAKLTGVSHGGISVLPIQFRHAVAAGELSSAHKDPFDRMLAAQCLNEHLPCVTKDRFFSECGVETIW